MSDQDKLSPSSPDSSSASESPSPDALDSGSIREIARGLHSLRQLSEDGKRSGEVAISQGRFREQTMITAIDRNTAEMRQLRGAVDRALRLMREVLRSERQTLEGTAKKLEDITGKFQVQPIDEAEVTQRYLKRWFVTTVVPWAMRHGLLLKVLGFALAAAAAAVGFFEALIHKVKH